MYRLLLAVSPEEAATVFGRGAADARIGEAVTTPCGVFLARCGRCQEEPVITTGTRVGVRCCREPRDDHRR